MLSRAAFTALAAAGACGLVVAVALTAADPAHMVAVISLLVAAGAFWLTGTVAFAVRPAHPTARRLLLVGGSVSVALGLATVLAAAPPAARTSPIAWFAATVSNFGNDVALAAWFGLFATFPSGRYTNRWLRVAGAGAVALALAAAAAGSLVARPQVALLGSAVTVVAPVPAALSAAAAAFPVHDADLFLLLPVAVGLMIVRAVRAPGDERIQIAWPLLTMALLSAIVVVGAVGFRLDAVPEPYSSLIFGVLIATVPLSLLIGMLRYRLLDLDLVLRRTLTYGILWLAIAAAFAGAVALAGLFAVSRLSTVPAVVVTIIAAMLFQPARERLERLADRVIFGDRERGYALIREFGSVLEGSPAAGDVPSRLAAIMRDGLGATWARTWLCDAAGAQPAGAAGIALGQPAAAAMVIPLRHGEDALGFLECGPRRAGGYTERDEEAVRALGLQAAVAIVNGRLAADLARSRARLVHAEAEERRRLERDIHDGVQQRLVALMARLSLARAQLANSPDSAAATLTEMQDDFRAAVAELRDLANGIHPAVLTDRGLVAALEARAARVPVAVAIRCTPGTETLRFPPDVEAAAYFAAVEAIGNALKHARASRITVTLGVDAGRLEMRVEDDGCGFDPASSPWRGLRGVMDRLEAVSGRVDVHAAPGRGTVVSLSLPVEEAVGV